MASTDPNHQGRTLILCFDGTGDSFDDDNTNIVRFFSALEKNKPDQQLCYYQPGIGTYVSPAAAWSPTLKKIAEMIDFAVAWYLDTHIMGGYRFLMDNYRRGDRICIFGFSRGAYTARCLAGMLHKVGLLPRSNVEQVEFAYSLYESRKPEDVARARKFKETFSSDVRVEFIGVWDTVSSVGFGAPLLPFNASETFIRTFRHALALDECRAKFQPNPWQYKKTCEVCGSRPRVQGDGVENIKTLVTGIEWPEDPQCWCEDEMLYHGGQLTDVLEVWFPGFHADVGGGNEKNTERFTLANPSLRWMVTEILKSNCGVIFKRGAFMNWLPRLNKRIPRAEMHNMLAEKWRWKILEYVPLYQYWLGEDRQTKHGYRFNLGRIRNIDQDIPLLHTSVLLRQVKDKNYQPEKRCTSQNEPRWVHEEDDLSDEIKEKERLYL
ncbi:hypothetical protein M407DRAFT_69969 [Tulasnella calospora MUT 4182]|uniref:T6SS Phospholipase effector Tle1-like catalytic domain-containing protein n=1 Tax=Tulasnella calospora MUT 4182 TaxID=1051891 RepID=A0A0C3QQI0_9AGAM|nr:hypothetical protein M407DRAFT_69969 [Tulasnella calospora MUT 4182]